MTERQVQLIRDFKPEIIMVTPSYMLAIADEMERQGFDPKKSSLRIGIFGAEPWTDEMRKGIEKRTSLQAVDLYGLSEVLGPGVALRMQRDPGRPDDLGGPFSIRRSSIRPRAPSWKTANRGELVFTSLSKEALPVIRYPARAI